MKGDKLAETEAGREQESRGSKDSSLPGQLAPADLLRATTGLGMFVPTHLMRAEHPNSSVRNLRLVMTAPQRLCPKVLSQGWKSLQHRRSQCPAPWASVGIALN